jgi:type I restriction enzyme S subunit
VSAAEVAEPSAGLRRFKPYPAYTGSGVEWLGDIPTHWKMKRLKHLAHIASGLALPESFDRSVGEYPVYGSNGLIGYCGQFLVALETLAVGRVGASGSVNIVPARSWVSDNALMLRDLRSSVRLAWLRYVLETMNLGTQAAKNAQPIITGTFVGAQALVVPPEPEQHTIAAFLDRETARIDALVAKKDRVIELLQEKRVALITRAVTKGLDPNVPMQDSGVEWLGDIPAHWDCLGLARVSVSRCDGPFGSGLKSEHYSSEGVRVVRLQNIGWAEFSDSDQAYIDEEYARELGDHSVVAGDLLIAGLGDERHPVGRACMAPAGIEPAMVKADCFRFRLDQRRLVSQFAEYQLSATASATAGSLSTGATRSRMNLTATATRKIALPPLEEQHAIVALLDRDREKFQALAGRVRDAIEHLKELRTALISAAVTGKIDVREEVA